MSKQTEYCIGWIDTTIHDFLVEIEDPSSSMAYALISCLDSNFDVSSMLESSKQLNSLKGKCHPVGQGIMLTTRQLLTLERQNRLFYGFDEVWFFPTSDVQVIPKNLVITGPDTINSAEIEEYSQWMRSSNCSLGLGDGTGMNFCLRVRGAARYIVKAFNEAGLHSLE